MLLGGIGVLSMVFALVLCACTGAFGSLAWLWLLPLGFLGGCLLLVLLAFGFLCLMCALVRVDVPQEKDSAFYRQMAYLYIDAIMQVARVRVHTSGLEKTPQNGRFLLVCNHLNESDPAILLSCFKKSQLAFISKQENSSMFVVGKIMHKIMCQLLNRENDREALKTILKCIQLIREDQVSIAVFPEGGIKGDDKFHSFRPGVFKIAQKTKVPIVVCTFRGTQHVFRNLAKWKPTDVHLHLLAVIQPEEYADLSTVELSERVHAMMAQDLGPEYAPAEQNT